MRVLVACEFSGTVRDAFRLQGHDAWSCDLLPTEVPGPHLQGDVREILDAGWDLLVAHPPCTYLSNAGVRHLHSVPSRRGTLPSVHGTKRVAALCDAADLFLTLFEAPVIRICCENPIPNRYAKELIGEYSQLIQPWQFGHGEVKATCLWLRGLPPLVPTDIVSGREPRIHRMSPGPHRARERSRTYPGIAWAMATQWGKDA